MVRRGASAVLAATLAGTLALAAAVATAGAQAGPPAAPPARVVSMNLCADQLAMALAAPGQLVSISYIARDPRASAMAAEAMAYPVNRGRAEEIYLLKPDLVLAGSFGGPAVAMLHRLGVPVIEVAPPSSLAEARAAIAQVGKALGRPQEAAAAIARFDAELAALRSPQGTDAPLAATWGANGYSAGSGTLAADILRTAGFALLTDRLGMQASGNIPLEVLVMADPDLIVTGTRYPAASRAEEVMDHPALERLHGRTLRVPDALWTCALPRTAQTVEMLAAEARALR